MTTLAQRHDMADIMDYLVEHEPQVHYPPGDRRLHKASDIRSVAELHKWVLDGRYSFDCSQTAEIVARLCGLDWPREAINGYTGTMLEFIKPHYTNPASANIGAFVVFGPGDGHHVCQVRRPGRNPLLFSHGQERGPFYISLSEEQKFQPKPATFLSIAHL